MMDQDLIAVANGRSDAAVAEMVIADNDPELTQILGRLNRLQFPVLEAFQLLGIGPTFGYAMINSGRLPAYYVGGKRMVDAVDIARFMLRRKREAAATQRADVRGEAAKERRLAALERGKAAPAPAAPMPTVTAPPAKRRRGRPPKAERVAEQQAPADA